MTANDLPFKSMPPEGLAEVDRSVLPEPVAEDARLDLLLPQDLPTEHTLRPAEREELAGVLTAFLQALHLADRAAGLRIVEALLAGFSDVRGEPAPTWETGIPASAAQVDDFDAYFRVNRITSNAPAHALVRGLMQTARASMSLFRRAEHLPERHVAQQIAGFIAYAHLLARTFDLGELS